MARKPHHRWTRNLVRALREKYRGRGVKSPEGPSRGNRVVPTRLESRFKKSCFLFPVGVIRMPTRIETRIKNHRNGN